MAASSRPAAAPHCMWNDGGEKVWIQLQKDLAIERKARSGDRNAYLNAGVLAGTAGAIREVYRKMPRFDLGDEVEWAGGGDPQ
eukprot:gene27566-55242_t